MIENLVKGVSNMNRKACFVITVISFFAVVNCAVTTVGSTAPVKEQKIQSGDVTLHIRIAGGPDPAPVLIGINGGPGMSSHYLASLEQLVGPGLSIVTFDQRGTGRSSESAEGYSLHRHIEDIENIRRFLEAEKLYIFGHSFGGIIAQYYSALHSERISGLILMGSGPPSFSAVGAAQDKFNQRFQSLTKDGIISGSPPMDPAEILEYRLPAYFSDPKFPIPHELLESSLNIEVSERTYFDIGEWDFREELKAIDCPVLFIWGEDDPFGEEMADATQKALINAELTSVTLSRCGHYWHENSEEFFAHVGKFLYAEDQDDVAAVIERCYFNGAFNDLDTASMREGFHSDFAIFSAEGADISRYPIDAWIEGIESRKADADYKSRAKADCNIVILDVTGNCAAAKVEISKNGRMIFTDYLTLLKFENGWKIVAKVYHRHVN